MDKRQRVFNLIENKEIDRTATGFWLHFPKEKHQGDEAVQAHIDFMEETDTDILKIMNENVLYEDGEKITQISHINRFKGYDKNCSLFKKQTEIQKKIIDKVGHKYPVIETVHGVFASLFHETGFAGNYSGMGYGLVVFCREQPKLMHNAIRIITDSLKEFVDASLESGVDGFMYAALGAEKNFFTQEEYKEFLFPYEKEVYDYIKSKSKIDIFHVCKSNIDLKRYTDINPTIVNWGIYSNNISLTQGQEIFPESIMLGGFADRSGVLVNGSEEDIENHTKAVLKEMKGKRFILGSDCTLPTEISCQRINKIVKIISQ